MSEKADARKRLTLATGRPGAGGPSMTGEGTSVMADLRADVRWARWAARLAGILLAGGLLAGCSEAWDTVSRPLDPLPPADPQELEAPQQGAGEYPNLSSVPEAPPRRPSGREERRQIQDSLAADRANARYTDQQQTGEGIEARSSSTGEGAGDRSAAGQSAEDGSAAATSASSSAAGGGGQTGGQGAGTQRSGAPERPDAAQDLPKDDTGASGTSGDRPAADSRDSAQQTDRQRQAQETSGGQTAGRSGGDGEAPDVPQLQQSQQGKPIKLPSQPNFDGAATTDGSGGDAADRDARARQQQSASRENPGSATAPGPQVGQSRTLSRQDAGGQPMPGGGRRVAVIYFRHASASLQGRDRDVLRKVAEIQQRQGRDLRVVGHASSRTAAMDPVDHRMANFDTSLTRAQAVVDALVSMGVPRDAIQLEARGDNEPVYHEFMPNGEAGNRRAEIFLQG